MCGRECYFDCFWRRHLFVEYRQHVCCCQCDTVGDHDLYGYGDEFGELYGYCHKNHHSESITISIHHDI